jgi:purine-nucleoside phosphorylase
MKNTRTIQHSVDELTARYGSAPQAALVLGSGMGPVFDRIQEVEGETSFSELGLPTTGVIGHSGRFCVGRLADLRIAALAGRIHGYEGYPADMQLRAVRVLARWGVSRIVLTSAVGSMHLEMPPGSLVRVTDHINLSGRNPLTGPNDLEIGPRFPDMSFAYDPVLGEDLEAASAASGVKLHHGVYATTSGPSYETPAEVRMLKLVGGDVVGMSLGPEVIGAVHAGLRVLAISIVSNYAAGLTEDALSHDEVTEVVGEAADRVALLLESLAHRWS